MVSTRSQKEKALVTGGAGFLGQHLVGQLLDSGKYDVTIFDIRDPGTARAPVIVGDLRDLSQVVAAVKDMDIVLHCATAAPTGENTLNKALMDAVNVQGTQNVIQACINAGVTRLVYTSSASVVFEGKNLNLVTEDQPYARKPLDYYTQTKIKGEQLVLAANGKSGLHTVALRPSGIFGENDPILVPTTIKQARAGKLKFMIGSGKQRLDWTYVGNVAQAHLCAADALADPTRRSHVAGKPFFVTNQDPKPFWGMLGDICEGLGYARPFIRLPFLLIIVIAMLFEYIIRPLLRPYKELNTDFTVSRMLIASSERTFSNEAAIRQLGYMPKVSMDDALQRTLKSFQHLRNTNPPASNGKKAV